MSRPAKNELHQSKVVANGRRTLAALALAVAFAVPEVANAWLPHQSGSACVPKQVDSAKIEYDAQFGIYNKNTSSAAVVFCPVVYNTDDFVNADGFAEVNFFDQHPSLDLSCAVTGVDRETTVGYSSGTLKSFGASPSYDALRFWSAVRITGPMLSHTVRCSIPPTSSGKPSRVVNYGIEYQD